jgi:hypothetical protein
MILFVTGIYQIQNTAFVYFPGYQLLSHNVGWGEKGV